MTPRKAKAKPAKKKAVKKVAKKANKQPTLSIADFQSKWGEVFEVIMSDLGSAPEMTGVDIEVSRWIRQGGLTYATAVTSLTKTIRKTTEEIEHSSEYRKDHGKSLELALDAQQTLKWLIKVLHSRNMLKAESKKQ